MGIIKNLLLKLEKLENNYKILQGKLDKLKINVDLINTKPKQFPDALTYKPQQPYIGKEGIDFEKIREATDVPDDIEVEVIKEGDKKILNFKNRPPYATYFPDEE